MDLRATKFLSSERQDSMLESCTWTCRLAANKDLFKSEDSLRLSVIMQCMTCTWKCLKLNQFKPNQFHLHTFVTPEDEESAGRVDRGDDGNARQVQDEDQVGGPRYSQYPFQVPSSNQYHSKILSMSYSNEPPFFKPHSTLPFTVGQLGHAMQWKTNRE